MIEAGHPVPDAAGLEAAERALALADSGGPNDLVLVLMSGGASANWIAPAAGISFDDKQSVTRALLRSGATIGEINTVRKHLSRIKGGRLARHAFPAPARDPRHLRRVGRRSFRDRFRADGARSDHACRRARYCREIPARRCRQRHRALADAANESPKPGDPIFAGSHFALAARPADALRAAESGRARCRLRLHILGDRVEGEARDVAAAHGRLARELRAKGARAAILSGGELTVTIRGKGRGGPNQEYALALAIALAGMPAVAALAGDTDGTDGGAGAASDPAGALADGETVARAGGQGLDPAAFLADNDSTGFFAALGDLLMPGPTFTNVNDFRAILVDRP